MSKAQTGDKVSIHYTGKLDNGEIFDSSVERDPLLFIIGRGMLIKGFEDGVIGMEKGEKKTISLVPAEAYGERMDQLVITVPESQFPPSMKPETGMMISIQQQNGATIPAMIIGVDSGNVTLDANHPLAGKNLTFELELVENHGQAAEDDECFGDSCEDGCCDSGCSGCH